MARVITYPTKSATLSAVSPVLYSAQNTEVNQIYQDLNDLDAGMALKAGEASQSFAALKFTGSSTVDSTGPTDAAAAFSTLGGASIAKTAHIGGGLLQITGANPELDIKPSSGSFASVRFYDLTNERFRVSYRSDASLFQISRYNASGVLQENTFEIDGATGNGIFRGTALSVSGANPELDIKPSSGSFASVRFYDLTNERFRVSYRSDASLFQIGRYNASGVLQENTFEIDGATGNITARKPFHITDTTASTSTVTGAGIIDGGLGVAGAVFANKFESLFTNGNAGIFISDGTGIGTITYTTGDLSLGYASIQIGSPTAPLGTWYNGSMAITSNAAASVTPPTNTNKCWLYGFSGEIRVKDSAGNVTTISPHEGDEWVFKSENKETGKKVKINMEKFIFRVGELLGENFFEEFVSGNN